MRRRLSLILCLAAIFKLAGCGNNNSSVRTSNQPAGVNDGLNAGMAEEDSKKNKTENPDSGSDNSLIHKQIFKGDYIYAL